MEFLEEIEQLRDLVRNHRVCYEVWPEYLMVGGRKVQVGFDLELCGTHDDQGCPLMPECAECREAFDDLRRIAVAVVPTDQSTVRCEIEPYDGALYESAKRQFRPEVILSIRILHRQDHSFELPVDRLEESCLKDIVRKLGGLGVSEGRYFRS